MITTLENFAALSVLGSLFQNFEAATKKQKEDKRKKKPFAIGIDSERNSTLLNSFLKSLKKYDKLTFDETVLTGIDVVDLADKGDVILFGQNEDVDVELAFFEDLPVEVRKGTTVYTLSDDLSKVYSAISAYIEANYPAKKQQPKFKKGNQVITIAGDVRRHYRFVKIGWDQYKIRKDYFGNEYITMNGEDYLLV